MTSNITDVDNNFLIFNVIDWHESDEVIEDNEDSESSDDSDVKETKYQYLNKKYVIKAFGRTENFESVYLRIEKFPPHFYILLPGSWTINIKSQCNRLINVLKRKNMSLEYTLKKYEIVKKKKLYGFYAGKQFNFLRLIFTNRKAMYDVAKMFDNKIDLLTGGRDRLVKFDVYESNIDPYIRFIHIQNLQSCGWIKVDKSKLGKNNEPNTCDRSYTVNWYDVIPHQCTKIAPFYICSFDLECKSDDGSFPQASRITDKIIQIGMTFTKYGVANISKKIMISLGTCDEIDGVEVYQCDTERELLLKFQEIIAREDPDILTGYNIFSFDQPYLMNRAKILNIDQRFYHLSKLKDYVCKLITKNLSSSALGDNKLNYIDSIGRVHIDLMKVVQRDEKLSSYKLDSVAENFFKDKVNEVIPNEDGSFTIKSKNIKILKPGNYVRFERDGEVIMLKFKVLDIEYDKGHFRIEKLDKQLIGNYKLVWGMVKDDIKPHQIFEFYEKTSAERKIIAEYCIQDCALVSNLMAKLEIITNNINMANVCHVPLHYIFFRGQGIKSLSLVAKFCRIEGYLIPVMKKDQNIDENSVGYEGATVFEPEIGFHRKPIPVLDYNSLYPSSIISKNVSHETLVELPEYDNLPGYIYYEVCYNNADGTQTHCKFAKKVDEFIDNEPSKSKRGIIPSILAGLLAERKATKKEMEKAEKEGDNFKAKILNGKQLALKITANSVYGQLGAPTSPIYLKHLAACTTAIGRGMLNTGKIFVENKLTGILLPLYQAVKDKNDEQYEALLKIHLKERDAKFEGNLKTFLPKLFDHYTIQPYIVYGDSVMPYTPILLKINNEITITTIEEFGKNLLNRGKQWMPYDEFKVNDTEIANRHDKEHILINDLDVLSFTSNGWSPVKQLIRHICNKAIYRISSHIGTVDVTEDHSLIRDDGIYVKPTEVDTNTSLLHNFPNIDDEHNVNIGIIQSTEEAKVMGFFVGVGSCGTYDTKYGIKYKWALNSQIIANLEECKRCLAIAEPDFNFKILDTIKSSNVYKLVPCGKIKQIVTKYRSLFYNTNKAKVIPKEILYASNDVRKAFLQGYFMADGNIKEHTWMNCSRIDTKNQSSAQCLYYLLKSLDYNVSINTRIDKPNIFRLTYSKNPFRKSPTKIKKISKLYDSYDGFVYDIETDIGNFQAGIGSMIVKNTDSIFIKMNLKNKITGQDVYDKSTLPLNIELGRVASKFLKTLLPYPHNMEYEKTLYPLALIAKKKYIGNKFENDPEHFKQMSMGVVLKRRDNANIVKKIVGGMVNIMLNEINIDKTIRFIKKTIGDLLKGKFEMHDFVTSKTLKGTYKGEKISSDETGKKGAIGIWKWEDVKCSQAHVCLAQRMRARDPGNAPQSNERIPYVTIVVHEKKGEKLLQGNKIELPDYILEKKLKIDYLFYLTNQIMNPSIQFLELIMKPGEANKLFNDFIMTEENKRKGLQSLLNPKFNIKKGEMNDNDNEIDIDSLINTSAKPNNKVKSKRINNEDKEFETLDDNVDVKD